MPLEEGRGIDGRGGHAATQPAADRAHKPPCFYPVRVRGRVLGILLLATLVGVGGGLGAGYLRQPQAASGGTATPVPAVSPSVPVDPPATVAPYDPDIPYPALTPELAFGRQRMGNSVQAWIVPFPKGWQAYSVPDNQAVPRKERSAYDELRYRPPDEPTEGGFSLRVKTVNAHVTTDTMVAERIRLIRKAYGEADVEVYGRTEDSVRFRFRDGNNRLRLNYFRYFVGPQSSEASLEMSVAGRQVDEAGLDWLFAAFASTLEPIRLSG